MRNSSKNTDLYRENNLNTGLIGDEFVKIINSENFNEFLCINGSFFYMVLDVSANMYQYVSPGVKNVLGYSQDFVMEKGASIGEELFHPDIVNTQRAIIEECHGFIRDKSPKTKSSYKFSFDLQVKDVNGVFVSLIQHNRIVKLHKNGDAALILSIFIKVPSCRKEIKQTLFISKINSTGEKLIVKKDFYPQFENGILTKTEIEVWSLISDGLSGKEIASRMGITVNTVNTHRKNIYKKLRDKSMQN